MEDTSVRSPTGGLKAWEFAGTQAWGSTMGAPRRFQGALVGQLRGQKLL